MGAESARLYAESLRQKDRGSFYLSNESKYILFNESQVYRQTLYFFERMIKNGRIYRKN